MSAATQPGAPVRSLVTGGAGFVGSHLCDRLIEDGHEVIVLDDFCTGRRENLAALLGHPRFLLYRHDVRVRFPELGRIDRVYHLACPASPKQYQRDPRFTLETSFIGSREAVDFAQAHGARVLLASTSEIYGDPEMHPQTESYRGSVNTTGPRACYDEGKRAAETLFGDARRMNIDARIARIFNTYGPRMDLEDGRVVSNFLVQAFTGREITIYGDGSQTRSFCYVSDLVDGLVRLMEHPTEAGPINLGNPAELRVDDLARKVLELAGRSPDAVVFRPLPEDDPTRRRPDISRAKMALGFEPRVGLEEGLRATAEDFRRRIR